MSPVRVNIGQLEPDALSNKGSLLETLHQALKNNKNPPLATY
jgi:hypothetical protein